MSTKKDYFLALVRLCVILFTLLAVSTQLLKVMEDEDAKMAVHHD